MTAISGARAPSQSSIVRRAPSRPSSRPPGRPNSASPITSAATMKVVFVAEPVVSSTNQGSATQVICAPVVEITSADEQRDDRAVAEHLCATHSSASGSSRRCGIGEGSSQSTPAIAPTVAIQSVGRSPIQVPSAPPASAPSGRTP